MYLAYTKKEAPDDCHRKNRQQVKATTPQQTFEQA
jgi:hypothetical protein